MSKLIVSTSWDDGCILDLKLAELLSKYALPATFYIPKHHLPNPLPKRELIMISNNFEIGGHTLNHVDLTAVSLGKAKEEIQGCKHYLEDILGKPIEIFSYPFGKFNEKIKELVKVASFIGARCSEHRCFEIPDDPYECPVTLQASNASPLENLKLWRKCRISIKSLVDWEIRAKLLFDLSLEKGGVYHLYGHSWEVDKNGEWDKLERVLEYIANRRDAEYLTNAEVAKISYRGMVRI